MTETLKILQLEDFPEDGDLLDRELRRAGIQFASKRVDNEKDFRRALEDWAPELVLADYSLPAFDGRRALELVREADSNLPFIFVSGAIGEEAAVELLRNGATDYVFKNRLFRLGPAVKRAMSEIAERRQRLRAQEALKRSEEQYRRLVELSPEGIVVHRDAHVLFANAAAARMLRVSPDELLGRSIYDLIHPDFRAVVSKRFREAMDQVMPLIRSKLIAEDGTEVEIEATSGPIEFDSTRCVQSIFRDVTESRRLEREILEISGREQRRIGQDLHDVLGQNLTGVCFLAKALEHRLQESDAPLQEQARRIADLVSKAIAQARALSRGLNPVALEREGLMAALEELADNTSQFFGVSCAFHCERPVYLDGPTATHLYHIALEAVNNAAKHSKANVLHISLNQNEGDVVLSVADNGQGFQNNSGQSKGMGLRILQHRANVLGASLEISSDREAGTVVTCLLRA